MQLKEIGVKATLRDVAKAAGVAESTASRALAGSMLISEETRTKVASAAKALGYTPRRRGTPAPSTDHASDRKGVVGVVVAALSNSFFPLMVDRIHDELDGLGYDMILIIDELSNSTSSRKIQSLIDHQLDGVIFMTSTIHSPSVDFLLDRGMPTVLAIRSNQRGNVDVVESDNRQAGVQAVRHLLELGHRRIGFAMGPKDTSTAEKRYLGGMSALETAGVGPDETPVVWSQFSHDGGYSAMIQLMERAEPPTAVFCGNDVMAIGALAAAQTLGLDVPRDVSLIGVDDIAMAAWPMIALTTVRQPIGEIGKIAARRLVARIEGEVSEPKREIFPTSLVQRRTTATIS